MFLIHPYLIILLLLFILIIALLLLLPLSPSPPHHHRHHCITTIIILLLLLLVSYFSSPRYSGRRSSGAVLCFEDQICVPRHFNSYSSSNSFPHPPLPVPPTVPYHQDNFIQPIFFKMVPTSSNIYERIGLS